MRRASKYKFSQARLARKIVRKEVRDICDTIVKNPDIIESEEFLSRNERWELKQPNYTGR